MENRLGLTTVFLSADNEHKLQLAIYELSIETAKAVEVVAIYPKGSKVICWVRVESKYVELAAGKPAKKKTRKKKVTKA
jgi:hypothetical protein